MGFVKRDPFNIDTTFRVEEENQGYLLHIGDYTDTGTAGDSMSNYDGRTFATWDRDNVDNCGKRFKGGFWYTG